MSCPPPPYLIEFRVARALMQGGNIGPNALIGLLDRGEAFLFDGDRADYEKCSDCNGLLQSHKHTFLKAENIDLAWQGAVSEKLVSKGKLKPTMRILATDTLRLAGIAARKNLTCVVASMGSIWNRCEVFAEGSVVWVEQGAFLSEYASTL